MNITGHQVISTLDLFKLIFEVLQLEEKINLSKESNVVSHYKISPYSFQPKESKKLVPKKFIESDLLDREHVIKSLEGFNFVIHFAGIADIGESKEKPLETIETNIIGTANLLEGCRKNKIEKFIFASSVYVFSKYGSFYGKSKQACELLIEEYQNEFNLDYIHVRYGSLYGPRAQEWNGLKKYISEIIKNKQIDFSGNGEEKREYIHVKDAAIMTASLLELSLIHI